MIDFTSLRRASFTEALGLSLIVLMILGGMMIFVPGVAPHIPILLAILFLIFYGMIVKVPYKQLQASMINSVTTSMGAIYLFFFIGILISALMMSGTIPTLIYYGLAIISPKVFYLSAFLLTAIIGITIGSSLTTVATVGVALIAMAQALDASLAITAGAIVSGAFFGDKMSPLSDTTSIAASIVGVDLFEHIRNMMYTTVPAFILSSIFYGVIALSDTKQNINGVAQFQQDILATNLVHWYALIPLVILISLAVMKIDAVLSMAITTFVSIGLTYWHASYTLEQLSGFFFSGFKMDHLPQTIESLIARGGISSMFFTLSVVILALSLGGLLFGLGIIPTLLERMAKLLTTTSRATMCVALTAVGINYVVGEQYLSILLAGKTFKPIYDKLHLHPKNLSRTLEDAGTVINPLVPWSVCGTFIASTLGVPVLTYLPFAIFCYVSLLLTVVFGLTGLTLTKTSVK